jgi:pimeloyl-ACP methyl ester carboxylesterase
VNGLRLYYEVEGAGLPLLLLNGGTIALDAPTNSLRILRPFLAHRFQVVHVDTRGHGRTDNPGGADSYTLPTITADIVALAEQLDLVPAHVVGFSLGGLVGLELAFAHPQLVWSVVGLGAYYRPDAKTRVGIQGFDPDRIEREDPTGAADLARYYDPHHAPGYWRDLLRWNMAVAVGARTYTVEDLERIAVPTLWIVGENDPVFELDQPLTMKRRIPGAELMIVNHADHASHKTHPHLVGPTIVDFLVRCDERRHP